MTTLYIAIQFDDGPILKAEVIAHQPAPWDSDELEFYVDAAYLEDATGAKIRNLTDAEIDKLDAQKDDVFNFAVGKAWADYELMS